MTVIFCVVVFLCLTVAPYIKTQHYPNLQRTEIDLEIVFHIKNFTPNIFLYKDLKGYIIKNAPENTMRLDFDDYERDLLIDTIQYRLDADKILVINNNLREELKDLLQKVEEDEYV